jgi:hypothetical protein
MSDHRERWRILAAEYRLARKVAHEALMAVKHSYGSVEDGTYGNPTDEQLRTWEEARSNLEAARGRVEHILPRSVPGNKTGKISPHRSGTHSVNGEAPPKQGSCIG